MLELVAAVGGIIGAMSVAYAQNSSKEQQFWFLGALGFSISNMLLFILASQKGLSSMAVQMVFFAASSFLMMYVRASKSVAVILLAMMIAVVVANIKVFANTFTVGIDIIPSIVAVVGSFLLSAKNVNNSVLIGYILFVLADFFYIYIGIAESMPWFTLQTIVYLGASAIAIHRLRGTQNESENCVLA